MLPQGRLLLLQGGAGEATSISEPHSIAAPPHHAQPQETIPRDCQVVSHHVSTHSSISISAAGFAATL